MKIDLRRGGAQNPNREYSDLSSAKRIQEQTQKEEPRVQRPVSDSLTPKILNWIIIGAIYLLTFLVPIFFLPNVPSVLELNKQMLIIVLGGIAFLSWIGKLAWEGKIRIKKNFLLVPVLVLLLVFALNTIFSFYRDQSMWGAFGTESLSLVSVIALIAVFFVITNNFDSKKKVSNLILTLITSSFLASLYGVFQMFGKFIFKDPALAQNSFNSIGSIYAFSAFIGAVLILTIAMILEKQRATVKFALIVFAILFVFVLVSINFRTTLITFLIGMAVLLGLSIITSGNEEKNRSLIIPMVVLTLILLTTLIGKNGSIVKVQLPVEVGLSQSASYDVLKSSWKEKFLLGPGLSMYDAAYLKGKPLEINQTNFWTVKFNEAASRFFTLATTVGFLGTAALLFLIGSVLVFMFSSLVKIFGRNEEGIYTLVGVTAMWIYLTILQFVYASNMTLDFAWWVATAAFVVLTTLVFKKKEEIISETSSPRVSLILSFVFVVIIVGFISLIFLESQKYAAAASYNKALTSDTKGAKLEDLVGKLGNVTNLDQSRDLYHRNLSVALFALLNQKVSEKGLGNLSENDRAEISNLYFAAEEQANAAINLNPRNPDNIVQLAQINQNVIGSKDGAEEAAVKAYRDALTYSPKDPSLYYQIGQVYLMMADLETAKAAGQQQNQKQTQLPDKAKEDIVLAQQNFEKAVEQKSNYIPAQFMIAVSMDRLGQIDQAIAQLEDSKKMNPQDVGILFQLGIFYYKAEKYDQARIQLEQAVKLADTYSNARYFLGLAYDKLNDKKNALEQFQKVSELNPDNQDVKKIISNLQAGKDALNGLQENTAGQSNQQGSQDQNSIQRDQQPVPPETPIDNGENQPQNPPQDQQQPNPAP